MWKSPQKPSPKTVCREWIIFILYMFRKRLPRYLLLIIIIYRDAVTIVNIESMCNQSSLARLRLRAVTRWYVTTHTHTFFSPFLETCVRIGNQHNLVCRGLTRNFPSFVPPYNCITDDYINVRFNKICLLCCIYRYCIYNSHTLCDIYLYCLASTSALTLSFHVFEHFRKYTLCTIYLLLHFRILA